MPSSTRTGREWVTLSGHNIRLQISKHIILCYNKKEGYIKVKNLLGHYVCIALVFPKTILDARLLSDISLRAGCFLSPMAESMISHSKETCA